MSVLPGALAHGLLCAKADHPPQTPEYSALHLCIYVMRLFIFRNQPTEVPQGLPAIQGATRLTLPNPPCNAHTTSDGKTAQQETLLNRTRPGQRQFCSIHPQEAGRAWEYEKPPVERCPATCQIFLA
jgi:hypothetical protein